MKPKPGNAFIPAGKAPGQRTGRTGLVHRRQRLEPKARGNSNSLPRRPGRPMMPPTTLPSGTSLKGGRVKQLASRAPRLAERGYGRWFRLRAIQAWDRLRGLKQAPTRSHNGKALSGKFETARSDQRQTLLGFLEGFHQNGLILGTGHNIQFGISAVAMKRAVAQFHITGPSTRP